MREPSWRQIADGLAERLMYNAGCETHPDPNEDQDCPFCADVRAYDAYVRKGGTVRKSIVTGKAVSIHDLRQTSGESP